MATGPKFPPGYPADIGAHLRDDLDSGGTSIDQLMAQQIGDRTMLPSFDWVWITRSGIDTAGGGFARMYGSFISWRGPAYAGSKEIIPQVGLLSPVRSNKSPVISSLNPDDPKLLTALQRDETSVLDLVRDQAKSCVAKAVRMTGSGLD